MSLDIRAQAARFYDLEDDPFDGRDIEFYRRLVSPATRVLELGCGTGRVLVPLAVHCGYIHGVDASEAMLARCRDRLAAEGIGPAKARVDVADITDLHLGCKFDLVTAPSRGMQNLETDAEVAGLFETVRPALARAELRAQRLRPSARRGDATPALGQPGERDGRVGAAAGRGRLVRYDQIRGAHPTS